MKSSSGPQPQPRSSTRRPGPIPICSGDVLVLAPLRLLEGEGEVAVVLGAAEVGQLAQAEPEDPVDQRVGELEILAVGHGVKEWARASAKVTSRLRSSSQSFSRTARIPSQSESVGTSWKTGFSSWARWRL